MPEQAQREVVARIKQATAYPQAPEFDVFVTVSNIARGWTNYYRYAHSSNKVAGRLLNVVFWRTAHYLGKKHRQSIRKVLRRHYVRSPHTDCRALFVHRPDAKPESDDRYFIWHQRPKRLSLFTKAGLTVQDTKPPLITNWASGHSLAQRAKAKAETNNTCQDCGRRDVTLTLHHPNRLHKVKRDRKGKNRVAQSGYDQQGKLLCQTCHLEHHHGHTSQ